MADVDETVEKLREEIREWIDGSVIGVIEQSSKVARDRAAEYGAQWAEHLNAEPLEVRIRALNYLTGRTETGIADVTFECRMQPFLDKPDEIYMAVTANVRIERPVETITVRFTKDAPTPILCSVCGLTQADPMANHHPARSAGMSVPLGREDGYCPHVFDPKDPGA
jgi:hypothetical protein